MRLGDRPSSTLEHVDGLSLLGVSAATMAAMKTLLMTVMLLSSSVAAARTGRQQANLPPDRPGVDFALRVGYAIPFGDVDGSGGNGLASRLDGAVPFVFEANYRFNRTLSAGPFFQYAIAQVKSDNALGCGGAVDCSGWVVRAGGQIIGHLDVGSIAMPWVGLGVGYEWLNVSGRVGNISGSVSDDGWEFATLQGGADIFVAPGFALGPFVSFSIARYGHTSGSLGGGTTTSDIMNPAVHEWLQLGARFAFSL